MSMGDLQVVPDVITSAHHTKRIHTRKCHGTKLEANSSI